MRSTFRRFRRGAIAAGASTALLLGGLAVALPADAAPVAAAAAASSSATQAVIVVLRDQVASAPADSAHVDARSAATSSAQQAVLGRLAGARPTKVTHYVTGNAFAATVTGAQAKALAADPAVASVVADTSVTVTPPATPAVPAAPAPGKAAGTLPSVTPKAPSSKAAAPAPAGPAVPSAPAPVSPKACSTNPRSPLLEPEALQTMNVRSSSSAARTAAALGIDGRGVKVAYIADGINPKNKAFLRTNGKSAIVDYKDFYGDGPDAPTSGAEAFGDASAMVAQGNVVYDVAKFANPKVVSFPGGHCYIKVVGVAPGASLVALKAGSELLPNSAILQAIDYAVRVSHVDVLNESFGANIYPDTSARNTIQLFNDQAVRAGVTVTVSTGDAGITSTIGNPSTDPLVISTGASTDSRIYEQTGYALATLVGNGRWQDSNISALSSAGITQSGRTIDLSTPGEADWAACDSSTTTVGGTVVPRFSGCTSFNGSLADIQPFGGTSQSAPLTAGVAALVIQAYRGTHGGVSPSPAVVKKIITSTARDLGLPGDEQGSGLIDARAAVEAALKYPVPKKVAPKAAGNTVVLSANQLTLEGRPGGTVKGAVTVTNTGSVTQRITAAARTYRDVAAPATQTVAIDAASTTTTPYPTNAAPWVVKTARFTVPKGADRLAATIAWTAPLNADGTGPVVRLSLFAPDGTFATNTRPQGGPFPANYGFVDVRKPAAGTWTAVFYTPSGTGYTGNVSFETRAQRAVAAGVVTPRTASVAKGRSTKVTLSFPVPRLGGDTVYTASVASSGGHTVAVPVIVRTLVPTTGSGGVFGGTITGGNARGGAPAQTFSYAFDVPKGTKDLDVLLALATNPADALETILVAPNGEVPSVSSNLVIDGKGGGTQGDAAQNVVAHPQPGRWRYVVVVLNPVSGQELRQDFRGVVTFDQVEASAPDLPNDASTTLSAGKPVTVNVTVKNTGVAPLPLQADARLDGLTALQLVPQFADGTVKLPQSVDDLSQLPAFLAPPGTTSLNVTSTSTTPAQVELNGPTGGIDLFGDLRQAQAGQLVSTASDTQRSGTVGQGYWFTYVQQIGPFSDAGAPAGTSVLTGTAVTQPFDTAVSSSTGDPYLPAVDAKNDGGVAVVIAPGDSATIAVTVTPTGAAGTVVKGVLNLVTTPYGTGAFNTTGDVIATLPYSYTIG